MADWRSILSTQERQEAAGRPRTRGRSAQGGGTLSLRTGDENDTRSRRGGWWLAIMTYKERASEKKERTQSAPNNTAGETGVT
jgi:hypothetical protein